VNIVNIGGDKEIRHSVRHSVYTMTNISNDVIAPTAQAATPAITFPSLPCSKVALPSPSPFLVFKSLHLTKICTLHKRLLVIIIFLGLPDCSLDSSAKLQTDIDEIS